MVKTGIDRLFQDKSVNLKGKRIGLLAHPASINAKLKHTLEVLLAHPDIQLTRLYGPEHGLWGTAQDMISVDSDRDPRSNLPVVSLYGTTEESLQPKPEDLKDIDVLICDLQDVGSRYYTFIYTMALCMKACAKASKEVIVLDRPNPINGIDTEGMPLKKGYESFVGLYAKMPVRHAMTIGELALYFNTEEKIGCDLKVVKMEGWKRSQFFDETGLPWILPSPNMPTLDTAIVYPGMCLIEATEVSEARGTTRPFELVGAPYVNAHALSESLNHLNLPGVAFRPAFFRPGFQKHAQTDCQGVQIHVQDRRAFKSYLTGVAILKTLHNLYPKDFKWREKPYEFVKDIPAIDLLTGDNRLRKQIESGTSLEEIQKNWSEGMDQFLEKRSFYLLY